MRRKLTRANEIEMKFMMSLFVSVHFHVQFVIILGDFAFPSRVNDVLFDIFFLKKFFYNLFKYLLLWQT